MKPEILLLQSNEEMEEILPQKLNSNYTHTTHIIGQLMYRGNGTKSGGREQKWWNGGDEKKLLCIVLIYTKLHNNNNNNPYLKVTNILL